jgi:hypothetical protein
MKMNYPNLKVHQFDAATLLRLMGSGFRDDMVQGASRKSLSHASYLETK